MHANRPPPRPILAAPLLIAVLLALCGAASCSSSGSAGQPEPIVAGTLTAEPIPFRIAEGRNLYSANGLAPAIKHYDTGPAAVDALLRGEVDIAWASEYVVVAQAFAHRDVRVLATIDRTSSIYLVGRQDRGIAGFSDLRGKRLGVPRQTLLEFYAARFLELHSMSTKDVSLVDVVPPQAVEALAGGHVDAVVTYQPYVGQSEHRLAGRVVTWPVQNTQPAYNLLLARPEWIAGHPDLVRRFLRAMAQAAEFAAAHPAEAKALLNARPQPPGSPDAELIWPEHQIALSLDQSLIVAMEDQARWMIDNSLTADRTVPDFPKYLYLDGLKAVKPEAVNVIR